MLNTILIPVLNDNYIYLINDPVTGQTAAVDPAVAPPVLSVLAKNQWRLAFIFNTHHHADHVGGNLELQHHTGCTIVAAEADRHRIPGINAGVSDGDTIQLGGHGIRIIATPGHTSGHIVYHFADHGLLFCGDTLFAMGCGRLFEGSAEQMWQSLQKLKALPADTKIYCAHEYTLTNGRFAQSLEPNNLGLQQRMAKVRALRRQGLPTLPSTIADEWATNPFFREHSDELQASVGMMGQPPLAVFTQTRRWKDRF